MVSRAVWSWSKVSDTHPPIQGVEKVGKGGVGRVFLNIFHILGQSFFIGADSIELAVSTAVFFLGVEESTFYDQFEERG